ncbi:hypothetical protein [Dysgonomonas sp. ZJ709]|uniref:hypothetical protein n=1 Tax=Dysgonomonas sp. ZJ709 TaxID=2709797 RepID=UPI0013EDEA35|nr:hypothetical protein [Dysgonomonas sp. ZJ709]
MEDIYQILRKERNEESNIYLYKMDDYWCAYERSAFYMSSICKVDTIFKTVNAMKESVMLITILKKRINDMKNPHLTILEQSDTNMVIKCHITCKGFLFWKESFIPVVSSPNSIEII